MADFELGHFGFFWRGSVVFEVLSSVVGTTLHSKELSDQTFWSDELERRFIHHNDSFSSQLPQLRDPVLFSKCFLSLFHTHTVLALLLLLMKLNSLALSLSHSHLPVGGLSITDQPLAHSLAKRALSHSLRRASARTVKSAPERKCTGASEMHDTHSHTHQTKRSLRTAFS